MCTGFRGAAFLDHRDVWLEIEEKSQLLAAERHRTVPGDEAYRAIVESVAGLPSHDLARGCQRSGAQRATVVPGSAAWLRNTVITPGRPRSASELCNVRSS